MKKKFVKAVSLVAALACLLCFPVKASAASQGTNGTELEVVQAQKLQVQLGEAWAGVEFQLRTDAGKYPDPIPVGENGILELEIGGSENYLLTCLASRVEIPEPGETEAVQDDATEETDSADMTEATVDGNEAVTEGSEVTEAPTENTQEPTVEADDQIAEIAGVPVTHVIIFAGGLIIAVALLIFMHMHQKSRNNLDDSNDDEDI